MSLEIVVVDDDKIIIYLHKVMLAKSGLCANPLTYLNGRDLVNFLNSDTNSTKKYLVLLDINMPEMNGWDFLETIKDKPYADRLYVIMVTSSIDSLDRDRARDYRNVIDFFEKPIDIEGCMRIRDIPAIARFFKQPG
jgi:CheY-like chemotaxis protein